LANPQSLNWRPFGQNLETKLLVFLQRCRTSGALVAPNLCGYVSYVNYLVKKEYLNRFGEPAFSRLTSIRPKPGNRTTYKDVAPLVLWKGQIYVTMFSMWAMWLKTSSSSAVKTNLNRFGEPAFSRLTSIRPKLGNETIGVSTKMSHLWCFGRALNLSGYVFYVGYVVKKNIQTVLANPHSFDWRPFGQNLETKPLVFLQRCRTSGALEAPNLCGYVFYVGYVVIKISQPFWRTRILLIDVLSAKTWKRNHWCFYKDVAPLVLW